MRYRTMSEGCAGHKDPERIGDRHFRTGLIGPTIFADPKALPHVAGALFVFRPPVPFPKGDMLPASPKKQLPSMTCGRAAPS
jgi:hypothetical protein